jgi:PhzF family phenazine biosynthesis protein
MVRPFSQVDVFSAEAYRGNPVAVVHDAHGLSTEQMQAFANWTNLSETTFLLSPTQAGADYRVRIFTPTQELPFAGHPTLGSCHAFLSTGSAALATRSTVDSAMTVVQECGVGLVPVRRGERLAFAATPLRRGGAVEAEVLDRVVEACGIDRSAVVDSAWVDNGPGWVAVRLATVDEVLAIRPRHAELDIGVVAAYPPGGPLAVEVRALFPKDGAMVEDPVTGSLNASLAQWLLGAGVLTAPYVAGQGTVLGRAGRAYIDQDPDGTIWVGGETVTRVTGTVDL